MKPAPLLVLCVLFAIAFSGRVISVAGASARAQETPRAEQIAAASEESRSNDSERPAPPTEETRREAAAPAPAQQPRAETRLADSDPLTLLGAIRERAAALDAREQRLDERESMLGVVEQRIETRRQELAAMTRELESRLSVATEAADKDITHLARMYESMKPQKAGEIFNAMEPSFAAGFLTEMNSDSAALILSNMSTENAYAASVIIAGRNATIRRP